MLQQLSEKSRKSELIRQILIVDSKVKDYQILTSVVRSGFEILILDANQDGIEQITDFFYSEPANQDYTSISLHLVSHGSPGCLYLGNKQLSLDTLDQYATQIRTWLWPYNAATSEVLLYGCNVAKGDTGEEFLRKLHTLTDTTIAASTSKTGHSHWGGTWNLDSVIGGKHNPSLAFDLTTIKAFQGVLAVSQPGFTETVFVSGLPSQVSAFTIDASTRTIFYADQGSTNGILRQITAAGEVSTITVDMTPGTGFFPFVATDIQFEKGFVYYSSSTGELVQVNAKTGDSSVITTFPSFSIESGLAVNRSRINNRSRILVTDGQGSANALWEYNLASGNTFERIPNLPSSAYGLEYDPVNDTYYFATNGSGFYVADPEAGTFSQISTAASGFGNFAVDPTGDYLYVRVDNVIRQITIADGSAIDFVTGLSEFDSTNELDFGPSSTGSGLSLYIADGDQILEIFGWTRPSQVTDFNNDNSIDLVWRNYVNGQNTIWNTDGETRITSSAIDAVQNTSWVIQAVGDFDYDGKRDDLLWRDKTTGQNTIWRMEGTQKVGQLTFDRTAPQWDIGGVGDFDHDGYADDIIWHQQVTGEIAVGIMHRNEQIGRIDFGTIDSRWQIKGTGNFKDSYFTDDLLWQNQLDGRIVIWRMDGQNKIAQKLLGTVDTTWEVKGVSNFDSDNRIDDLLFRNQSTGEATTWYTENFSRVGTNPITPTLADLSWDVVV